MTKPTITIAVIGDVHDQWQEEDHQALKHLGVDLVLFVGDFGNESVEIVRAIAKIDIPKAVILGNHDAWYSASDWGKSKSPYDHKTEDRVQQQLDLLGETHVGYGYLDFPDLNLSVVGARPFSWGGEEWKNGDFLRDRYGIHGFAESTQRIIENAKQTAYSTVLLLSHNGPTGLGDRDYNPCGKDWLPVGGDHGDPDFAEAIAAIYQVPKAVPFATFGHMHHKLRNNTRLREAIAVNDRGTVFLNAASVPRIVQKLDGNHRNFSLVQLTDGKVAQISLVWLDPTFQITSEQILYHA
ncbi:TIGR04168 family protein [Tumidithrix elongata RA019]|uniref:TIGR04168 family protein n=1 Tax=Tumidithrix elongata BACA0141 TaxID=2716417 RepID=A0AAW9PYK0_9CYAN|nr:TIGR04168 family protein [Tumidithrix elongata RA019]